MRFNTTELHRLFSYDPTTGLLTRKVRMGKLAAGTIVGRNQFNHGRGTKHAVVTGINKKLGVVSRIIWQMVHGEFDEALVIDHINGDPFDNRILNLRLVPQSLNAKNLKNKKNNKSGYPGVYFKKDKRKWCVEIWVMGTKHFLGYYKTFEEAKIRRQTMQASFGFPKNHGRMVQ